MLAEKRIIKYSQQKVEGHIAFDDFISEDHVVKQFEFLAVELDDAPFVDTFMMKGLLGLSTSVKSIEDLGTELETYLQGPLFMDQLLLQERIVKNQFSILMTYDHN